jgi:hypothetical protein
VFTARYALSPYIKQIRLVFKGLMDMELIGITHFVYYTKSVPAEKPLPLKDTFIECSLRVFVFRNV